MSQTPSGSSQEDVPIKYVCGIDVRSQSCSGCVCRPDKSVVVKPVAFANAKDWLGGVVRETHPLGRRSQADPHRHGSHFPLWRESLSGGPGARLSALFVASWPNASVSSAARIARQDRSARCSDHCQGAVEWRSAGRLCPKPSRSPRIAN